MKYIFISIYLIVSFLLFYFLFQDLYILDSSEFYGSISLFQYFSNQPLFWKYIKIIFIFTYFFSSYVVSFSIFSRIFSNQRVFTSALKEKVKTKNLTLLVGTDSYNHDVFIPEKGLYQNFLITGSIGSGKTSGTLYPFTKQFMEYKCDSFEEKLGFLILDVKGSYYNTVLTYAKSLSREQDVLLIQIGNKFHYNPLDKPNLRASVLAGRLKDILLLFSPNNSESYWLDKVEEIIENCINFCRLYNNGYVNFKEIHELCNNQQYYIEKVKSVRHLFLQGKVGKKSSYTLLKVIEFFENEFFTLDQRTLGILKSEISRITHLFISDYEILDTFSPSHRSPTTVNFRDVINKGKIVVLSMRISEYKNLSKVIAAYLKIDFQTEILSRLNSPKVSQRPMAFICDEYQEYITSSDSDFFSQSRESKCINIVSTQSYTSLLNTLNNKYSTRIIIQNLVNKLWLRTDDLFTIDEIQKQIGKIEKEKISKNISENAQESKYHPILRYFTSKKSNLSESVHFSKQLEYLFDSSYFSQHLESFSCIAFLSDGNKVLPPSKLKLKPYFSKETSNHEKK